MKHLNGLKRILVSYGTKCAQFITKYSLALFVIIATIAIYFAAHYEVPSIKDDDNFLLNSDTQVAEWKFEDYDYNTQINYGIDQQIIEHFIYDTEITILYISGAETIRNYEVRISNRAKALELADYIEELWRAVGIPKTINVLVVDPYNHERIAYYITRDYQQ